MPEGNGRIIDEVLREKPDTIKGFLVLFFLFGFTIPFRTIKPGYWGSGSGFFDRVSFSDLLLVFLVIAFIFLNRRKIFVNTYFILYLLGIHIAFVFSYINRELVDAYLSTYAGDAIQGSLTAAIALVMASLYWIIGYNMLTRKKVLEYFLYGVIASVFIEFIIVFHDYVFSPMWFPDTDPLRVRGTFFKNGQLAAYAYSTAGLLTSIGWLILPRRYFKFTTIASLFCLFFVIAASRRSAMVSLFVWLLAYLVLNMEKFYIKKSAFVMVFALAGFTVYYLAGEKIEQLFSDTYLLLRVTKAPIYAENYTANATFIQFIQSLNTIQYWFPMGFGVGRGHLIAADHLEYRGEIHSGLLALLVEMGVWGLLSFSALVLRPVFIRKKIAWKGDVRGSWIVFTAFIISAGTFMLYNRLQRDRSFLILIGIANAFYFEVYKYYVNQKRLDLNP